ncbi:MAG: HAD family hydrolase [Dehalococcoidia bacterium]|nr:HAD family hydrolase [Dehalococcoidia bacterium]
MTAVIFDLDGTLVDSVYQHVVAWQAGLRAAGIELAVWRIHRRIGMSGGLLAHALLREAGRDLDDATLRRVQDVHREEYLARVGSIRPLPGAVELLGYLTSEAVPWTVATSGRLATARPVLDLLPAPGTGLLVTRDDVSRAKPDPDLFIEAARRLGQPVEDSVIVGDSVWDLLAARRAHALGVGLLSGGYGRDELQAAGAYRVYDDPADLLDHLDEVGIRR